MELYVICALLLFLFVYCAYKKKNPYNAFLTGAKGALSLCASVFPYLVAIFLMTELLAISGIMPKVAAFIAPALRCLGIPKELSTLILIKPFSGSGSMAILSEVYKTHGVDSYISRTASVIMGTSDTLFYLVAVYFSKTKVKRLLFAIPVALISNLAGTVVACFICRVL